MLLTVLALLGSVLHVPAPVTVPTPLAALGVELALQVTESHFAVENLGCTTQLLVFRDAESGIRGARPLAPGERLLLRLPTTLSEGFRLEVFEAPGLHGRSTGSFGVEDLQQLASGTAFAVAEGSSLVLVEVDGSSVQGVPTGPSLYPALLHVPAPIPSADRRAPTRRIERRPLPPV